ncbi:MAG: hypothetical protein JSW28_08015, partial [Thermoplasmata archaeon]
MSKVSSVLVCLVVIMGGWPLIEENVVENNPSSEGTEGIMDPVPQNDVGSSLSSGGSGGSGGLADSPWPMFRQNLNHTGQSPYDTSSNNGMLKWSFITGGPIVSSPVIDTEGT